ncbi:hypothetical protein AQUCO_00900311v1 [Aquilegia coerulea]|uniref:MI domain-containing protein n=1 Tax=Aquilegia coerulea TaxID=218851 RepID=A0A2G5ED08_AQUCA|nr:hypothetical protein AQUCO_00900311v1 [Aquilegia coerulea]
MVRNHDRSSSSSSSLEEGEARTDPRSKKTSNNSGGRRDTRVDSMRKRDDDDRDSSESDSDKEISRSKVDRRNNHNGRDRDDVRDDRERESSKRRRETELSEKVISESEIEIDEKEKRRYLDRDRVRVRDSRRRIERKRHHDDVDSSNSDDDNDDLDKKSKKIDETEKRHDDGGRDRDYRRRDDRRRYDDDDDDGRKKKKKKKESRGRLSEEEEEEDNKLEESKGRGRHEESYRRREATDGEREKRLDRKRDYRHDDRHRKPKGGEGEDENRWRGEREAKEVKEKVEDGRKGGNSDTLRNNGVNPDAANLGRSGGVYIPPFKLAQMMKEVEDKSSVEYQRLTWDALRKSINGLVNKVNAANIKNIVTELFAENLIRGRGLFCRSCMKSQMASPGFTDVFSALVAVVNTKFPEVGELLLKRIVLQLKRAYKRNDKHQLLAATKFVAHLVNQQVAHEILALELLTVLLERPTDDSVEVAVGFVTECGSLLQDISPQGLNGIFERFRGILHEGEIDKRVQYLIEGLFAIRKAKFQGHPAVRPELDLVDQEDQLTHEVSLEDKIEPDTTLDIFKPDPQFLENERRYEELVKNILGDDSVQDDASSDESSDDEEDEDSDEEEEEEMKIKDETETNLVNLRRTIYLTIMSSVDFEEAGHKLLKIKLEPGQEMELCIMLLECCSQERTYLRYYGLLGQRFCMINKIHQENFETCFVQQYSMIHRLETNKLRNVAKFFAHLLGTDALPWHVLSYIRLTEDDTTSSSRIFIKILFQELSEHLGIRLLNEKLTDPSMQASFESIFPKDHPRNTRFSINFFTSIGLGGITENLREYLKNMPRLIMQQQNVAESDESGSSSSSSSSGSSSSDSESERKVSRKKRRRRD